MTTTEPEGPCDLRCGYEGSGQSLLNHMLWEHRPCADCGGIPGGAPDNAAVRHRPTCLRLRPGYVYPTPVTSL